MQVGVAAQVASSGDADFVRDAERIGATSAWVAETWGQDALTPLAASRVPADLGAKTNLIGTAAMVADRLRLYRDAGITTLEAKLDGDRTTRLDTLAQLRDLVAAIAGNGLPRTPGRPTI